MNPQYFNVFLSFDVSGIPGDHTSYYRAVYAYPCQDRPFWAKFYEQYHDLHRGMSSRVVKLTQSELPPGLPVIMGHWSPIWQRGGEQDGWPVYGPLHKPPYHFSGEVSRKLTLALFQAHKRPGVTL